MKIYAIQEYTAIDYENAKGYYWEVSSNENYPKYVNADFATINQALSLLNAGVKSEVLAVISDECRKVQKELSRLKEVAEAVDTLTDLQRKLFNPFIDFDKLVSGVEIERLQKKHDELDAKYERIRAGKYDENMIEIPKKYEYEELKMISGNDLMRLLY